MTFPGTHAGLSVLTWGKPAFCSHLGLSCPFVVSFSPVGVPWSLFSCFYSPHSLWCSLFLGVGVLPPFPGFLRVFVFSIMNRLFKRTVILDGSGFFETVKVEHRSLSFLAVRMFCLFSLCLAVLSG